MLGYGGGELCASLCDGGTAQRQSLRRLGSHIDTQAVAEERFAAHMLSGRCLHSSKGAIDGVGGETFGNEAGELVTRVRHETEAAQRPSFGLFGCVDRC